MDFGWESCKNFLLQVGIQAQTWNSYNRERKIQSKVGCKGLLWYWWHLLTWGILTCGKPHLSQSDLVYNCYVWLWDGTIGCQDSFSTWTAWRSLHGSARRVHKKKQSLYVKEVTLWLKTVTKEVVREIRWLHQQGFSMSQHDSYVYFTKLKSQ